MIVIGQNNPRKNGGINLPQGLQQAGLEIRSPLRLEHDVLMLEIGSGDQITPGAAYRVWRRLEWKAASLTLS